MEELTQRRKRIRLGYGTVAVHCMVAEPVDYSRLAKNRLACGMLEARFVD